LFGHFGKINYTNILVTIENNFRFSSINTTNIQKALKSTEAGNKHTNIKQTVVDLQRYFTWGIMFWLCLAGLKVHQGKQRIIKHLSLFHVYHICKPVWYMDLNFGMNLRCIHLVDEGEHKKWGALPNALLWLRVCLCCAAFRLHQVVCKMLTAA